MSRRLGLENRYLLSIIYVIIITEISCTGWMIGFPIARTVESRDSLSTVCVGRAGQGVT